MSHNYTEDRLEILRLVENQTVSADEALRIIEALDRSEAGRQHAGPVPPMDADMTQAIPPPPGHDMYAAPGPLPSKTPRVRIRISEQNGEKVKLNLVLPGGLLDAGLKMVRRVSPSYRLDPKAIRESINLGYEGPLIDINDNDDRIEILLER